MKSPFLAAVKRNVASTRVIAGVMLRFLKPKGWLTVITAALCIAAAASCAENPKETTRAAEITDLFGTYDFEEAVYMWPASSYLPLKGHMPTYILSEEGLTIKNQNATQQIPAQFRRCDFSAEDFKKSFDFDVGIPEISLYKAYCYYALNGEGGTGETVQFPVYRIYLMDGEVWLASMTGKKDGGMLSFGNIYLLKRTVGAVAEKLR